MKNDDLFHEIRAAAPIDTGWANTEEGQRVMTRALGMPPAALEPRAPQRRRRIALASVATVALVGGTAAAAVVVARQADSPTQAGCYETLSANADTIEPSPDLVAKVGALEACRQTWASVGDSPVETSNLVSCVNPDGGRGIFPAPGGVDAASACGQIGWQPEG